MTDVQVPEEQQEGVPDLVNLLKDFDDSPTQTDIEKVEATTRRDFCIWIFRDRTFCLAPTHKS